jgi:hypothetical protein
MSEDPLSPNRLATVAFEIADAIANDGGYSDDPDEADRRADERDRLVPIITATLKAELQA